MSAPPQRKPAPVARKSSAAIPPSTFYTGPTVPKKGKSDGPLPVAPTTRESVTGESKMNVDGKNLEQIVESKGLVPPATLAINPRASSLRNPRSHRWLNSTILLILLTSLFSLYACPPPNSTTAQPSFYTKLNPFIATPHLVPAWESIVCKPTNVYRTTVLEPYVVPHVQRRISKIRGNPIVREYIEPAVVEVQTRAQAVWKQRLERPAQRVQLALEHINGRYLAPRVPIIKARLERLVAYVWHQLTHTYLGLWNAVSSHPTFVDFERRLAPITDTVRERVSSAWHAVVPHVHRAQRNAQPIAKRWGGHAVTSGRKGMDTARKSLVPRVARTVEVGLDRVEVAWEQLVAQLRQLYATRVHPLLHPHYSSVEPHVNTFSERIYQPYLHAPLIRLRPLLYSLVLTPSYTDIRRAVRAGYLDTRAAVEQGVESVKDKIHAVEDKVDSVVGDVKGKVGATVSSVSSGAKEATATVYEAGRNYRQEAIDKARVAQQAAVESSVSARASAASASNVVAASVESVSGRAESTVSSIVAEVETGAASVASGVSAQGVAAGKTASEYARGAVNSVIDEAQRASASVYSAASQVSASVGSVGDRATRSGGSLAAEASQGVVSATSSISAGVHGAASAVSASGSSVIDQATRVAGSVASVASQNVRGAASSVSEGANQASASVVSAGQQVVASGSSVVDQARHGASQVSASASHTVSSVGSQVSQSVGSVASAAQGSASSVSVRAASAVQPNTETLDPLDPSATEFGTNPGKTTVPHNPGAEQVAALFAEEGVANKVREQIVSKDEVVAKDPTYIKQEAAGAIHAYLKTHVPRIAQDRLVALERDATATTRAFQQLLSSLELSSEAKDVAAERAKVKASLKTVRAKLDDLVATLEKDLQGGLINAGAKKEVDKLIDAAIMAAGSNPPATLRQSYNDAVHSVLDTLTNVNEAIAQEGRLVLKPYRKEAKDRADQALALLDGKATAAVIPTGTVGRVAEAAAGTIGRAKDQIIADIKHATEAGSSVYQSVTKGAANAASTGVGKTGLDEQAEAVLAGLADFRNQVNEVVGDVTQSGKAGAASVTQAIKDEL